MPKVVGHVEFVTKYAECDNCLSINEYTPNEVILVEDGIVIRRGFYCAGCGGFILAR